MMERTVPRTGGEEIQLYMRTYYSLLRSSGQFAIETLVESHTAMGSSLHVGATDERPDVSALIYGALRLPPCICHIEQILVGQMERAFVEAGYTDVAQWERVYAPGRRRRMHYDGESALAVYIMSRSDIDDLLPTLVAYQIEWNKLHQSMQNGAARDFIETLTPKTVLTPDEMQTLADLLKMSLDDLRRLEIVWRGSFVETLILISQAEKDIAVRMLAGSFSDYRRATAAWWEELEKNIANTGLDIDKRPIYFVSSNTHSMINLLTGFARRYEESLIEYMTHSGHETLLAQYETTREKTHAYDNFLYYVLGKYLSDNKATVERVRAEERSIGIIRVPNKHGFEIEAQVIDLAKLQPEWFDTRLTHDLEAQDLPQSDALILNIDYPLGMAAYEVLSRITERTSQLQGVYVMGKAATLNARIGDVMIPSVIHDEHSQNTYLFQNCFGAADVRPYMARGNVLDNQKAVTCLGTFLQNPGYMSVFYREGYTDIEMEGGPYLSAIYEAYRPRRHPENEIVNLHAVPFDVGFLHYASDMPMRTGHNLGAGNLAYTGVESTYATTITILRRIFQREGERMRKRQIIASL
jgi:hypothetical protein